MAAVDIPIPIFNHITLLDVAVVAVHNDSTSPPSTWTLRARVNQDSTDDATFTFNWNASAGTREVSTGQWSTQLDLAPGDWLLLRTDGSAIEDPQAVVTLGYRIRTPR